MIAESGAEFGHHQVRAAPGNSHETLLPLAALYRIYARLAWRDINSLSKQLHGPAAFSGGVKISERETTFAQATSEA
jgi:hypothetical protein